jgi:hypothetical protein
VKANPVGYVATHVGMFKFSIEESGSEERWIIQGRLAGAFAGELDSAWNLSLQRKPVTVAGHRPQRCCLH